MFLFKKIVASFFFPLSLCLELLLLGLAFLWFSRRQAAGKILVSAGTGLLLLFSYSPIPGLLLSSLEWRYPPLLVGAGSHTGSRQAQDVKWIVVLGGGFTDNSSLPVTSQIGTESLFRVLEGVRLYKAGLGQKLIFSGGEVFGHAPVSKVMARVAQIMGVDPRNMVLESRSRDTEEEARFLKAKLEGSPFILVTSAYHLPRAMALFRHQGLAPLPAPAGHLVSRVKLVPSGYFPDSEGLRQAQIAMHEYLGLLWARIRGQI